MADYVDVVDAHENFLIDSLSDRQRIIHALYLLAEEMSKVDFIATGEDIETVLDAIEYLKGVEQHGD